MKEIKIVFKIIRKVAAALIANGIIAVLLGILIIAFPVLLVYFVALALFVSAIIFFGLGYYIYKHSKITFRL